MSRKKFGFDLLREQAQDLALLRVNAIEAQAVGDSPIEKLFYSALRFSVMGGWAGPWGGLILLRTEDEEREYLQSYLSGNTDLVERYALLIRPQALVAEQWRVDFLINATAFEEATNRRFWRRVVIECDGHDFHERTKEQAAKDRSRDRGLVLDGYTVLRFTGSELWGDPVGKIWDVVEAAWGPHV